MLTYLVPNSQTSFSVFIHSQVDLLSKYYLYASNF